MREEKLSEKKKKDKTLKLLHVTGEKRSRAHFPDC